tara:strand:+ start:284 stop:568 length:285 start_codon:yes stop_codon:yes gene_type:complete
MKKSSKKLKLKDLLEEADKLQQYKKDTGPEDLIKDAENIFKFIDKFESIDYENANLEGLESEVKNLSNNLKKKYKDYMSEEDYKDLEEDLDFEE